MRKDFFYTPNHIPVEERKRNIGVSLCLLAYAGYGVYVNDLFVIIPFGRRSHKWIHLHDVPAWVMFGAVICACLVLISTVVDHYDTRNNERYYKFFADTFFFAGAVMFGVSIIMAIVH